MTNTDPIEPRADMNKTTDYVHIDDGDMNGSAPSPQDDFTELAKKTADYLYSLSDDCPAELRQPIATLRQLINEEYVGKDKTVGSQLIWDILGKAIQSYLDTKVREAERSGEVSALKIQKMWAELHGLTGEQLYGGICHAIDSIEQFPDQPLASKTLSELTQEQTQ